MTIDPEIEICRNLSLMIGLPIFESGRAGNMQWIHFGSPRTTTTPRGRTLTVGQFALPLQCSWRFRDNKTILVGSDDLYLPAEEADEDADFDWNRSETRRDRRMKQLLLSNNNALVVRHIEALANLDIKIRFIGDLTLDINSFSSSSSERWRLIDYSAPGQSRHFVVTGAGIE
jgi:hypothetical protein